MNPIPGRSGILTMPSFYHPAFEDAYRFIINGYRVPEHEICIFLPCSMKKPFSTSPSHRIFDAVIASRLPPGAAHRVVFGTCGVVPRELERMFPFTHYRYMLGKCTDERIKRDFYRIETPRLAGYLRKTRETYRHRVAYCLGGFRKAMISASEETGIPVRILPTDASIRRQQRSDLAFADGSLHMEAYLEEFGKALAALASSEK
ncbi:MAG: tRNA-ribosyltransferase [Methanoculleus sp. SDB]|nr:MAG: tRNA-ribosyltransferase [Methanoculleus sp. SDB]